MNLTTTEFVRRLQEYPAIPCEGLRGPELPAWRYMPADSSPLAELRRRYGLAELAAGKAELPAALAVLDWAYRVMRHDGGSAVPEPNALNILDACFQEQRAVNCFMKAIVLNEAYLSLGYRSRRITCMPAEADGDCHVVVMVYIAALSRWITVDPTHNTYFMAPEGEIINVLEARRIYRDGGVPGLRHIETPKVGAIVCAGVECASYDEFYTLYMAKNCFRFSSPVESGFGYESRPDAQFIHLSPPGYDPATGVEYGYDPERCFSTHDGSTFLAAP
jgi:hypothetical protein